jgi:O-antigen ligase
MIFEIILFTIIFTALTFYRLQIGLGLFFLLLPTYLIRFSIGSLPTTLLEVMLGIIFIAWLFEISNRRLTNFKFQISNFSSSKYKLFFISTSLFLIATTISIFTSIDTRAALGEWKAFYIEPFLLFIILTTTIIKTKQKKHLTNTILIALILSGLATTILAIYQHFTGWMVPHAFWANGDSYRVTAWYGFPNGVGLFIAPLIPMAIYLLLHYKKQYKYAVQTLCIVFLIAGPLAVLYAKSTGGLIGIAAGIGLLLLFYKKTRWPAIVLGSIVLISIFAIPKLDSIQTEVTFQDRSGQIRLAIYNETLTFLKDHPIAGAGLASFSERIVPYHKTVNGEGIEIFHHPHNIFLTMWVNLGLLGLIGFIGIIISNFLFLISVLKQKNIPPQISYFLIASFTTIIITGLVDSPYVKNDLAILFWAITALLFANVYTKNKQ